MEAKAQHNAQQTTKSGQVAMTTFNGQEKKMKNSTAFKTVLAPNAPWPKTEVKEKPQKKTKQPKKAVKKAPELNLEALGKPINKNSPRIKFDGRNVDFFANTYEQLHHIKNTPLPRARDKLSGRFKSNKGVA
jgi:hypothetical protein